MTQQETAERQPMPNAGTSVTHVLMAVDKSGSMYDLAADVIGGFNGYLDNLADDTEHQYAITAALFDHHYHPHAQAAPLAGVPRLSRDTYRPGGITALLDAVGRLVADFDASRARQPGDRVIMVIQTDGAENASHEYTLASIRQLITERQDRDGWVFVFIGAGTDVWTQAQGMGIARGTTYSVDRSAQGTRDSYAGLTGATRAFAGGHDAAQVLRESLGTQGEGP